MQRRCLPQMLVTQKPRRVKRTVDVISVRQPIDLAYNFLGLKELIGCSFHKDSFTCGNELVIIRCDPGPKNLDPVREDAATALPADIPVGVVG